MAFREEQSMLGRWWTIPLVLVVAGAMWWGFVQQVIFGKPWGNNPGPDWMMWLFALLFGIAFPIFFMRLRLIVEVHKDHVYIRFVPIARRRIPFTDIDRVEPRKYRPIAEYGGWGIKGWSKRKISYSVRGNQGVELHLRDGNSVMIGTREPEKLARAIDKAMAQGIASGSA